jgi:hypothetical protein
LGGGTGTGGRGGEAPDPVPTNVVTLWASRVTLKLPAETGMAVPWASWSIADVSHGITDVALKPLRLMLKAVLEVLLLMATMAKLPVFGSW